MSITLYSWNVNGIRANIRKGFLDFVDAHQPDVLCLQETKAMPEQVELDLPGYELYWNSAERKGYSGTALFTKIKPLRVWNHIGVPEHDTEGRVITAEFNNCYVVTVYTPNAGNDLRRLEYRVRWDADFLQHIKTLEETKPVLVCGDLNVAHNEIDLARPKANVGNAGFTEEERTGFRNIIKADLVDTFRSFQPEGGHYSWWSYRAGARDRNVGWRLDYFCASQNFMDNVQDAKIHPEVMGSDHCPVSVTVGSI